MIWLLGLAICLILSAFFSATEMAFLSTDRVKLRDEAEQGNRRASRLLTLYRDSREFLTTILIGNNLVNVSAASILAFYLESRFSIQNEWVVTAILAPVLIVFSEIVPKGYGRLRARGHLFEYTPLILFFSKLFAEPSRWLLAAAKIFPGGGGEAKEKNIFVNEDEFRFLIEESVRHGVLEEHEKQLVERILDFERIPIERVLIPVEKVPRIELSEKVGRAKACARESGSKVMLVYEEIPNIVIGMIYVFDLLFEAQEEEGLRAYLRSPIFLPKETSLEKAFLTLQEKRQSFAVATDARGEVIGLVNIERLLAL